MENYMETMEGKKLPIKHCIKGSEGWKLYDAVNYLPLATKVFEKETFPSLELANYLKDNFGI